jgi:purine-cytosine permease-like protein
MYPWQSAANIIASMRKTSALFPLLVLVVVLAILTGLVTPFVSALLQFILILAVIVVSLAVLCAYFYFARYDPNMLRSEQHVIQKTLMEIMGDETRQFKATPADFIAVINPRNPLRENERIAAPEVKDKQLPPPEEV